MCWCIVIQSRSYRKEADFDKILIFLREIYVETKSIFSYFPNRFENDKDNYVTGIHIWEEIGLEKNAQKTEIVGLSLPERKYQYNIQVKPKYEFLYSEIIAWICEHAERVNHIDKDTKELRIVALEENILLEKALTENNFNKTNVYGFLRIWNNKKDDKEYPIPEGFTIRSIKGKEEYQKYAKAIQETFGHGNWFDKELVEELNSNSYYNKEFDLIVEAPNGDIASFCTFRTDSVIKVTELEPMGTLPKYRKLGLAKALLYEGFTRLKSFDPPLVYIGGAADNPGANKLYESMGFDKKGTYYIWKKQI